MAGSIFRVLVAFLAAGVFWGNLMLLVPTNPNHVATWWKAGTGLALFVLFVAPSVWRAAMRYYARANLAPLQSENERLRAEVRDAYAAADSKAGWEWKKRAEQAEARAERLRAELDEQCRLHAIGMERELKLINERDRLLKEALVLNERAGRLADALMEYGLPLTGDYTHDVLEFGHEAVAREERRRAALAQEGRNG